MKWKLPQPAKAKRLRKDAWAGSPIHVGVLGFCGFVLRACSGSLFHFGARSDQRRKGRPSFWYIPNRVHRSGRSVGQSIRSTKIREFLAQGNPEANETRDTCKTYARRSREPSLAMVQHQPDQSNRHQANCFAGIKLRVLLDKLMDCTGK